MPYREGHRIRAIELIDTQAGGDVSRIVVDGVGELPGASVLEKARYLESHGDGLRRLLLSEPYGDPAMCVNLVLPATDERADIGYIIMEAMGYPQYSGSNTICTVTAVLQSGIVPIEGDGPHHVTLESPAGLVNVVAHCRDGWVESVTTQGGAVYVADRDRKVEVPNYGRVSYDLVWSGAFYALMDAEPLGFELVREEESALTAFSDAFIRAARPQFTERHPELGDVGPLSFLHIAGPLEESGADGWSSRSATHVHPGVICRSPTGTGTSARLARLSDRGLIEPGQWLDTISPRGTSFRGTVLGPTTVGDYPALHTNITGRARTLSHTRVIVDLDDPMIDASDLEHLLP